MQPDKVGNRCGHLPQRHCFPDSRSFRNATGDVHDQRHMNQFAVQAVAVIIQVVLPKCLAMVRRDDHQQVLIHLARPQCGEKFTQLRVLIGHCGVVRILHAFLKLIAWRLRAGDQRVPLRQCRRVRRPRISLRELRIVQVWVVRVHQIEERKKRLLRAPVEPRFKSLRDFLRRRVPLLPAPHALHHIFQLVT